MHDELTVKEYAAVERVTTRTVRNWIEKGAVPESRIRRTPGGGIRIIQSASVFVLRMKPGENGGKSSG